MIELRQAALEILAITDPHIKASRVFALFDQYQEQCVNLSISTVFDPQGLDLPGRPEKPQLIPPLQVPRRTMASTEGRVTLLHSLAHIEFNAINLALDAIWRFPEMPEQYYEDWLKVAKEEVYHFTLVNGYIESFGFHYGDFPAHNSLWEMVHRTSESVIARMALVPRTMEARGLDAVPMIRDRFKQVKDARAVEILEIILHDEIGHVLIGNRWFNFLCTQNGLSPISAYRELARKYCAPVLKGPFNMEARKQAGFTAQELDLLGA